MNFPLRLPSWRDRLVWALVDIGSIALSLHRLTLKLLKARIGARPAARNPGASRAFVTHINNAGGASIEPRAYLPRWWVKALGTVLICIAGAACGAAVGLLVIFNFR